MPASQKIITKLSERRQIEADLRTMLAAGSELEFRRQAQQIAALGSQVIPAIVGSLDRADSRLLTAMGTVATFLDRGEVTRALRQAVIQPQRTDQGRMGAMTILERFLGETPDDDLLSSLADPEGTAIASLEEVLARAEGSPAVLIDYVQGRDRQEPDVVLGVVDALRDKGVSSTTELQSMSGHALRNVEPLRMLAQDVRGEIAAAALEALGSIRHVEAARALQMLIPIVAPELQPMAERSLRKLRFIGVEMPALPDPKPAWRALISPVDGLGQQSVWFILDDGRPAGARFLNILLTDRVGAVEATGHERVPRLALPPQRPAGYVHDIALPDGSGAMLMLETNFDVGRRLVVEALPHNRETQIPVAGVLRLLSSWLWSVAGADSLPPGRLPELEVEDQSLVAISERLLAHPAFATWTARSEATLMAAEEALRHPGWDREVWVKRLAGDLFGEPVVGQVLSRRLVAMSEWFLLAGEELWSRMALVSARSILEEMPQGHPFAQALVRRDLELAVQSLKQQSRPVFGPD
jgi:hypothetical protein